MGRDIGCGGPLQSGVLKPKAGDGSIPRCGRGEPPVVVGDRDEESITARGGVGRKLPSMWMGMANRLYSGELNTLTNTFLVLDRGVTPMERRKLE